MISATEEHRSARKGVLMQCVCAQFRFQTRDGCVILDFRVPFQPWLTVEIKKRPMRVSEALVLARPVAFRGWNPNSEANHPPKAKAGRKFKKISKVLLLVFNQENRRAASIVITVDQSTNEQNICSTNAVFQI